MLSLARARARMRARSTKHYGQKGDALHIAIGDGIAVPSGCGAPDH